MQNERCVEEALLWFFLNNTLMESVYFYSGLIVADCIGCNCSN